MTKHSFRVAIWGVMALVVIVAEGTKTVASAADCEIPAFLGTGKTYAFVIGMASVYVTVVEIDRQACWGRDHTKKTGESGTAWCDLRQVSVIGEAQAPSTQVQPGQRR